MAHIEKRNEDHEVAGSANVAARPAPEGDLEAGSGEADEKISAAPGTKRQEEGAAEPTSTPPEYDTWRTGP